MPHLLTRNIKHLLLIFKVLLCFIFLLSNFSYSKAAISKKDSINKVIKVLKNKGDQCFKDKDVYNAIDYYSKYSKLKANDVKRQYRIAGLYYQTRNYPNARHYYDSVISLKLKKYPLSLYYKGVVCMNLQDYNAAIECFTTFKKKYKKRNDKEGFRKLAATYIESSEWAKVQNDTNNKIDIIHLNSQVNSNQIDFSPTPVNEQTIYYGALKKDTSKNSSPVRQLYEAQKVNNHWQTIGSLNNLINIPNVNTGNAALSPDGKTLYLTRSRKNWKNESINEIYVSHLEGNEWQEPEKLPYPINDDNSTNTQPSVGKNLKTGAEILYFVSNRLNGKGGLDIWSSEYDKRTSTFKEPRDLDKNINTIGDECTPFYDASTRTLYFSSTGRNGFGGYDIYKSTGTLKKWTEAEHLPTPINSPFDEYYYSTFKNGIEGFFTSNRPGSYSLENGSCCDDIFYYKYNECAKVHAIGKVINYANYDFYDKLNEKYHLGLVYPENNKPLPNVPIELYLIEKSTDNEILIEQTQTLADGAYSFDLERNKNYKVLIKNYGYFNKKIDLSSMNIECNDTLNANVTQLSYMPKINVRVNIYYEHNKSKLSPESKIAIDTTIVPIFDMFPNAIIEIGSHTDSTGTEEYNFELSQRRSESVVNYLTEKGIAPERLVAKGYGESMPVAPNSKPDGTDNPEGRQLNRRTEMRIVGEVNNLNIDE